MYHLLKIKNLIWNFCAQNLNKNLSEIWNFRALGTHFWTHLSAPTQYHPIFCPVYTECPYFSIIYTEWPPVLQQIILSSITPFLWKPVGAGMSLSYMSPPGVYISMNKDKANVQYVPGASPPPPPVKQQEDKETVR